MNAIEQLQVALRKALPSATLALRTPRDPQGTFWLDASLDEHRVSVEWSARRGFGVSASLLGDGYGEGPEEVFTELQEALQRTRDLLAERQHTRPPTKVLLQELRARLGLTQQQLADRLGVKQAAVSRLEHRDDITLASLQRYVEALGGTLEIGVRDASGEAWSLLSEAQPRAAHLHSQPDDRAAREPSFDALVMYCRDLQASKSFYATLGCALTEEQHRAGPVHYSFPSAGMLVELYPSSDTRPPTRGLRLSLRVSEPRERLRQLEASKCLQPASVAPRASKNRVSYLVRDPDDNVIELTDPDARPSDMPSPV